MCYFLCTTSFNPTPFSCSRPLSASSPTFWKFLHPNPLQSNRQRLSLASKIIQQSQRYSEIQTKSLSLSDHFRSKRCWIWQTASISHGTKGCGEKKKRQKSADPSPPSSRGRRLGRTKQMALALTFCLVARNSHVSAATIRHRAFSGVEGLSTPGALLFRMGCPAPIPLHSPCF